KSLKQSPFRLKTINKITNIHKISPPFLIKSTKILLKYPLHLSKIPPHPKSTQKSKTTLQTTITHIAQRSLNWIAKLSLAIMVRASIATYLVNISKIVDLKLIK
ncbi:MAG: hypothetical protein ACK5BE_02510, partial [Alphaproteobacteria bacterium]